MPIPDPHAPPPGPADEIVRRFVEHWGLMARSWGINATMGELFALLYITATDWTAEDLRERLEISRGNVSMNLRELMAWGAVHKAHRPGERRDVYRAERDVGTLFRRIADERKRRELEPTLTLLDRLAAEALGHDDLGPIADRLAALGRFFALVELLTDRFVRSEGDALQYLRQLLDDPNPPGPPA